MPHSAPAGHDKAAPPAAQSRARDHEPSRTPVATGPQLEKALGAFELFALGFGGIVGAGWVVAIGGWLRDAGPGGAIVAFAVGGAVMSLVGLCYSEITTSLPRSGGEVVYAYDVFGLRACFAMGWCLTLAYIATTIFEALSVAWIVEALFPWSLGPALYTVAGQTVHVGTLVLGLSGMAIVTYINYRGVRPAAKAQDVVTYAKIVIAALFIGAGLVWGEVRNLAPLTPAPNAGSQWAGIAAVLTTSAFWYGGFNTIAQVMGEKSATTSLRTAGRMTVLSIAAAAVFYCLVILSTSMVVPWRQLLAAPLPVASAFASAFRSELLAKLVLITALLGIFTVWNGVAMAASRVLFAMGRAHLVPPRLGDVHPRFGSPAVAVVASGLVAAGGILLGRGVIGPVVNVASTCFALGYLLVCLAVVRLRQTRRTLPRPYAVPGGSITAVLAAVASAGIVVLSLRVPASSALPFPAEWLVLAGWAFIGFAFWNVSRSLRAGLMEEERRDRLVGSLS